VTSPLDSGWWGTPVHEDAPDPGIASHDELDPDRFASQVQRLALWEQELRQEDRRLADWGAWLQSQTPFTPAWSLPAEPVTAALRTLYRDQYLGGGDIQAFATGFGLDPTETRQLLNGEVDEVDIDKITQLCEALKCSPYEVWEPEVARTILHAYGPERWPRYMEPLDDGRVQLDETFVNRRSAQQALDVLQTTELPPQSRHSHTAIELVVTCYGEAGVLQVDDDGVITNVHDHTHPAVEGFEYHLAFRQLEPDRVVTAPLSQTEFDAGPGAGVDADPALVEVAATLRQEPQLRGTAMVRFASGSGESEQWIGWDRGSATWQTWDDPRAYFPGDPADVLAGINRDEPLPLRLADDDNFSELALDTTSSLEL
jgi:hypothetical protein